MCPKGAHVFRLSQAGKTKEMLSISSHNLVSEETVGASSLSSCTWVKTSLQKRKNNTLEAESLSCHGRSVLPNEDCWWMPDAWRFWTHNYWPGFVERLAAWLGPKWLEKIDNSELFFSSEIPLAISSSWNHNSGSKIQMWLCSWVLAPFWDTK